MKIIRDSETFKIQLPPYKINIKDTKNKLKKNYQYSCILPPFLCSYFNITETDDTLGNYSNIMFYEYEKELYITSRKNISEASIINEKREQIEKDLERYSKRYNKPEEKIEELEKQYDELPCITNMIFDDRCFSTAYKLTKSNSYRLTLPNLFFRDKIKVNQNNYILFTIDTVTTEFLRKGIVKVDIIQE